MSEIERNSEVCGNYCAAQIIGFQRAGRARGAKFVWLVRIRDLGSYGSFRPGRRAGFSGGFRISIRVGKFAFRICRRAPVDGFFRWLLVVMVVVVFFLRWMVCVLNSSTRDNREGRGDFQGCDRWCYD